MSGEPERREDAGDQDSGWGTKYVVVLGSLAALIALFSYLSVVYR